MSLDTFGVWLGTTVLGPVAKLWYKYKTKRVHIDPPFVLICNHASNFDPIFIALTLHVPIHYLATDTISNIPVLGKGLQKLFEPIPIDKNDIDVNAIRAMRNYVKEGKAVGFFPEGNRTFDGGMIDFKPSTAKLIKTLGVPIVAFNIKGGYFKSPRWGSKIRGGNVTGDIGRIITTDEIKQMSVAQLYDTLKASINVDAYAIQSLECNEYPSRHNAEFIEALLYMCPNCGRLHTIYGKGNYIHCSACGDRYLLDNFGKIHGAKFDNITDWSRWQFEQSQLTDYSTYPTERPIYTDDRYALKTRLTGDTKIKKRGTGSISLYPDRIEFVSKRAIRRVFPMSDIVSAAPHGRSNLHLRMSDGESVKLRTVHNKANGLKYYHAYLNLKSKQDTERNSAE